MKSNHEADEPRLFLWEVIVCHLSIVSPGFLRRSHMAHVRIYIINPEDYFFDARISLDRRSSLSASFARLVAR